VLVDGENIAAFGERRLGRYRASTLGLMLQGVASTLLPYATPAECVRFATGTDATEDPVLVGAGLENERRPAAQLDRAQRQLTALAVVMARRPALLLLDEPSSGLADDERDSLFDALVAAAERSGTTVVVVTHDEEVAGRMQRMVRMRDGRIGAEGLRHDQYAVIGADGSIQLPEALADRWPAGAQVRVEQVEEMLQIRHREPGDGR
jgi:ABC-type lipoprotein export system ATPase subunit